MVQSQMVWGFSQDDSCACSPEELLKGPKLIASSAPGVRYREPISFEDVTDAKQR